VLATQIAPALSAITDAVPVSVANPRKARFHRGGLGVSLFRPWSMVPFLDSM
jgi:hypothetical protein